MTAAELNGWLATQPNSSGLRALAHRLGRSRGYPASLLLWSEHQVAVIRRDLDRQLAPGAPGIFRWGGGAAVPIHLQPTDSADPADCAALGGHSRREGIPESREG